MIPTNSASFTEILARRALETPDATAFVFRDDEGERHLTYGQLDERACSIAAAIHERHEPGERALLLCPPSLDYVAALFGCLYAGAVAVPAYPPDPLRLERTLPRLMAVIEDARPGVALTTEGIREALAECLPAAPDVRPLRYVAADAEPEAADRHWQPHEAVREDVALLQYTSGSTASPRGVLLTHDNLLRNSEFIRQEFGNTARSRGVLWLPPYHDMGLIGGVLQPVYAGFPCMLMSPLTFLRQPLSWLRAISEHRATVSGAPNFAFDLCVRRVDPEQRAKLDLSCWEVAFNGSEPVRADTIDSFSEYFADCGFRREALYPCYGLAEATLMVTGGARMQRPCVRRLDRAALERDGAAVSAGDDPRAKSVVGCGRPERGHRVVIVDPATCRRLPDGRVGEIWVSGPSVAAGYWKRPQETRVVFGAVPAEETGGPFLRTGDLGLALDGELFVTGRDKELIIVGGRNHHPPDIELCCEEAVPGLRRGCGAAFAFDTSGRERIGIVYEVADVATPDHGELIRGLRRAVARSLEAQVGAVALIRPRTIPKTSSGKVQRRLCRSLFLEGGLEVVAEWSLPTTGTGDARARAAS